MYTMRFDSLHFVLGAVVALLVLVAVAGRREGIDDVLDKESQTRTQTKSREQKWHIREKGEDLEYHGGPSPVIDVHAVRQV